MFHWDLPQALPGGWQNRDTAKAFADYAGYAAAKLSDRVHNFMTTNEIRCFTDLGHKVGIHAPGMKLPDREANQVRHHGVLGHGLAVQAIRAFARPGTQVGLAENPNFFVPAIETPEHIEAARRATRDDNAPFLTAVLEGRYLDSYLREAGAAAPKVEAGDMKAIGSPLDFVAINVYTPQYVRADAGPRGYAIIPHLEASPHMRRPGSTSDRRWLTGPSATSPSCGTRAPSTFRRTAARPTIRSSPAASTMPTASCTSGTI
jgi:beta-glucosidase